MWYGFLVVLGIAGLVAAQTAKGAATIELAVGARIEWRKVVLAYQAKSGTQTTLIVLAVILLMALILWGIDSLLSWIASLIMG